MTLQSFIEKYNGKYLEVAGTPNALNQCTDLANGYIRDVLNLPIIEWTNARDFPSKANGNYDWIPNTPDGVPQEGDLVIWNNTTAGHIAVFIEGNANSFKSFDQNYPTGSPCHIQNHTYAGVAGWMRPKNVQNNVQEGVNPNDTKKAIQFDKITSFLHSISILPTDRSEDVIDGDGLLHGVENLDTENKRKADEITKLTQQLNDAHVEAGELKNEISDRQNAINTLNLKISDLNQAMEADAVEDHDMGVKILELEKQLAEKDREITDLKEEKVAPLEPAINHYQNIIETLWPNLYKSKKAQSLREKFWKWIS